MKRFSNFVVIEKSLREAKILIEEDLNGENGRIAGEKNYSSQLVSDIELLLAIMDNLKTGALYSAIGTTTSSKLVQYVKRIAEKIEKNQREIDKQYKKDLKDCVDRLCNENGIAKFNSIEDLEEVLYILKDNTQYEPYIELESNNMIGELIELLKNMKNDEEDYKAYRDSYTVIANGLENVTKRVEKQNAVIKHLGKDFKLSVFQGYLRDKIKSLVTADSALYRAAYTNAYGASATAEAEEKGAFFADARIDVDIVTRFLLKDTGLEEKIIDKFKSEQLANNRLVKNNSYDKLKATMDVLVNLDEEYQKLLNLKTRKDAILMERRGNVPGANASDEDRKTYLEQFIIPESTRGEKWNEEILASSNLSQSLGTDGIMHLPSDRYEFALGDFAEFISDYTSYVNSQEQFITLLENFKNPEINIYLKNRADLERRINEIDDLLGNEITPKINELTHNIEKIIPKDSGLFSRFAARLSNRSDLKELEKEREELILKREQLINERKNKHDNELVANASELINNFKIELGSYLGLFEMWNINVDLDFVLDYNVEELKNLYKNNVKELEEAYKKRIKIILDDLARVTNSNPQNMYRLAEENGINLEKPSGLVPAALKNFISFLNNCSAINGIADPSILKWATELCQAKVSIDEVDFEGLFKEQIKDMDAFILGDLPEEIEVSLNAEEEQTEETASLSDELDVPVTTKAPEAIMTDFKIASFGDGLTDEEQREKDAKEHPEVVKAVQNAFADYDAQVAEFASSKPIVVPEVENETETVEPIVIPQEVTEEPDDDKDYFNDLLVILNGKVPDTPKRSVLEPTPLPAQGARPLFNYDADAEDVVFKPQSSKTMEFEIPVATPEEPDEDNGLKLTLTNPNQDK